MSPLVAVLKRLVDLVVAGVGLVVVAPFFPVISLAIYVDSPGPVFYRQRRAGRLVDGDGHHLQYVEFDMLKFRTMGVHSEKGTGAVLAAKNDPRVTRVGKVLRKTRLDELPQLLNVLAGDMSIVGPRPERREILEKLAHEIPFFEERMRDVKPGITGLAQVSLNYQGDADPSSLIAQLHPSIVRGDLQRGAGETPPAVDGSVADGMRMKLLYDLAYIASLEHLATWLPTELRIIFTTPWVMIRGLGR